MSIESVIFTALSVAGVPVFPTVPAQDTPYPYMVYEGIQTEPILNLAGEIKMEIDHFDVMFVGINWQTLYALADTVKAAIHNQTVDTQRILFNDRRVDDTKQMLIHNYRII